MAPREVNLTAIDKQTFLSTAADAIAQVNEQAGLEGVLEKKKGESVRAWKGGVGDKTVQSLESVQKDRTLRTDVKKILPPN